MTIEPQARFFVINITSGLGFMVFGITAERTPESVGAIVYSCKSFKSTRYQTNIFVFNPIHNIISFILGT